MAKAWEKCAPEFGILVCFASFHFAFQLAAKPRRITNSKVLAVVFHRSLLQASTPAKNSKITQNREAKKAKWQAMFLFQQGMLPQSSMDNLHFVFALSHFSTTLT